MRIILITCLGVVMLASCEKIEVDQDFTTFGEVYFDANNTAIANAGHLKVKYNAQPIDMGIDGRIRVPEGEGIFEFYDARTGEVLLDKSVNILSGSSERYTLFQPTLDAPVTFFDENAQADEEAAPDGYYKVKFVDYTGDILPFDKKIDIVVFRAEFSWITFETEYVEIGVLEDIGNDLEVERYHLIPIQAGDEGLSFSFRETDTGHQLVTVAGNELLNDSFYKSLVSASASLSDPKKNVFTAYIEAYAIDYQNDNFLKVGDKLYGIRPVIFLKD